MASASDEPAKEMVHNTKVIQFFGRTTPVLLQNDNGPCPLISISNVLLLRNKLDLSPDVAEVSQEKLLSLIAEQFIDSNSDSYNKDVGYVETQLWSIADAIDLLPRLATGIDVNIKFRKIDDFEFTRDITIFDLLDIQLCHGWIVDPEDSETAAAIGSKSYNTLMEELVALETPNQGSEYDASMTATLGVPPPSLSRKGDLEEEEELLRVLKISKAEFPTTENDADVVYTDENVTVLKVANNFNDLITFDTIPGNDVASPSKGIQENSNGQSIYECGSNNIEDEPTPDRSITNSSASVSSSESVTPSSYEAFTSSADESEPMYEGEKCILEEGTSSFEEREPLYDTISKDDITSKQGELIKNFLKNSASQLTVYGLSCLQQDLSESELCVFFRNNHFNTMFKLNGELYILATDQGYINQPDLVWEKLNEVNGDSMFMTGNFKEFKVDDHGNSSWNEQNAWANTADYLASFEKSGEAPSGLNSDLDFALALQQQEYEEEPQWQHTMPQQIGIPQRLATGPQVQRNTSSSSSSSRQEKKSWKNKRS